MRFRHAFIGIGGILIVFILLLTDPQNDIITNLPFGSGTLAMLIVLFSSLLYIGFLHIARKGLLDYIDLKIYFEKALLTPEGSGLALIAVGLIMISIAITISAAVK